MSRTRFPLMAAVAVVVTAAVAVIVATSGAVAGRIATVTQAGGAAQVTYKGHPLYYYVGDRSPGQTSGQGLNQFGALWYVLGPGGNAVTSAPTSPAPASGAGSSSYGY